MLDLAVNLLDSVKTRDPGLYTHRCADTRRESCSIRVRLGKSHAFAKDGTETTSSISLCKLIPVQRVFLRAKTAEEMV